MDILSHHQLSLAPATSASAEQIPRSHLVIQGQPTSTLVDGAILEAALQSGGRHLVFTTDDIPMEDMLRITLFDQNLQVLDKAVIGNIYSTGSFSLLASEEESLVRFRFMGDTEWSVQVLPEPRLRLPFLGDPRAVTRPPGLSRYFIVRGHPQPQED